MNAIHDELHAMRLCIDCQHQGRSSLTGMTTCGWTRGQRTDGLDELCSTERHSGGCGQFGIHFEPKVVK